MTPTLGALRGQMINQHVHTLKVWPEYFCALDAKVKPFEVRKADRDYKVGDTLYLQEWDPGAQDFTGRITWAEITYVLHGGQFGIEAGWVVLGLEL